MLRTAERLNSASQVAHNVFSFVSPSKFLGVVPVTPLVTRLFNILLLIAADNCRQHGHVALCRDQAIDSESYEVPDPVLGGIAALRAFGICQSEAKTREGRRSSPAGAEILSRYVTLRKEES